MSLTKDKTRPAPKTLAEREAAIGRYGVKSLKSMDARNGVAFSFTATRDGKTFAHVREEGNGGCVFVDTKTRADFDTFVQDAIDWYVGSPDESDSDVADNTLPIEMEHTLVWELYEREMVRKQLMGFTRGGKVVLFQVGDEIRGTDFSSYGGLAVSQIAGTVTKVIAEAKGQPVRIVSRDPANTRQLLDKVHNL